MLDLIKKAIDEEMQKYACELHEELRAKYLREFSEKLHSHRNKVVLDVISNFKMEMETSHITGETNIHMK